MIQTHDLLTNLQLFNPVEIKPEMVGMYSGEFSMSYRCVLSPSSAYIPACLSLHTSNPRYHLRCCMWHGLTHRVFSPLS